MRQVVVIHGGNSFETYGEYLQSLKDFPVELEGPTGWKSGLGKALGPEYQVISPRMPNAMNARYFEWKLWFEKYIPLLNEDVIFIGHSLGGSFLAKYLSEETYPKRIKGVFLIAAPFNGPCEGSHEFLITHDLELLQKQGGELFLYHSTDDTGVPFTELEKYKAALPDSHVHSFTDRGHFLQEEFSEIIDDIKSLG